VIRRRHRVSLSRTVGTAGDDRVPATTALTGWVLAHKLVVALAWTLATLAGVATVSQVTGALSQKLGVPGREASQVNEAITSRLRLAGDLPPLVAVVELPPGASVDSPAVRTELAGAFGRISRAVPGSRVLSYPATGDSTFVSADRRTTFAEILLAPEHGFELSNAALRAATRAVAGVRVAGAPVRLTGLDVLAANGGRTGGPGVLAEAVLGALGALAVLALVFASWLALVPLMIAIVSILTTFLLVGGLTAVTEVSFIVQYLIALIGLGVAIDYSLLIVVRWREERHKGSENEAAIVTAIATAGRAVVLSGTTVAIGLLALVVLPVPSCAASATAGC
jgi:RND superfamily putative drug exporter